MGFMDLRQWLGLLEKNGDLRRIGAEVHWDRELGAVARRVLEKKGPALLFENITGYTGGRCTRLFTGGRSPLFSVPSTKSLAGSRSFKPC